MLVYVDSTVAITIAILGATDHGALEHLDVRYLITVLIMEDGMVDLDVAILTEVATTAMEAVMAGMEAVMGAGAGVGSANSAHKAA